MSWKRDVALELWIDDVADPTTIRLAGTLDGATAVHLRAVVAELIGDGHRDIVLETSALRMPGPGGLEALSDLGRLVAESGGRLARGGSTDHSGPDREDHPGSGRDRVPVARAALEPVA